MTKTMRFAGLFLAAGLMLPGAALAQDGGTFAGFYLGAGAAYQFNGETRDNSPNPIPYGFSTSGGYGVALAGYRTQFGSIVLGGEIDASFGSSEDSERVVVPNVTYDGQVGIGNFTSLRAQIGFTPTPSTLVFAAIGPIRAELAGRTVVTSPLFGPFSPFTAVDARSTETGLIYGVGGEVALGEHWRTRLEYSHFRFDEFPFVQVTPGSPNASYVAKVNGDVVRATVNWQF